MFTEADCNVCATGAYLDLHAAATGTLTIDIGKPGPVTDVLSGTIVGASPRFKLPLQCGKLEF